MQIFTYILLGFLVVCAVSVSLSKNLLNSILIYMSYSLVMSIIWLLLESPDLAITEAAVGAGVTSLLFFVTLKKIQAIVKADENLIGQPDEEANGKPGENLNMGLDGKRAEGPDRKSGENSAEGPGRKSEENSAERTNKESGKNSAEESDRKSEENSGGKPDGKEETDEQKAF